MSLTKEFRAVILKIADEVDPPKKERKYSNRYLLEKFCDMLEHYTKWRSLDHCNKKKKKNYYSSVLKRFHIWSKKRVFERAYYEILKDKIFGEIEISDVIDLFIDGTLIENRGGIDCYGKGENKKKFNTKLTVLCDENKVIYTVIANPGNKSDTKTLIPSIECLQKGVQFEKCNVIGDKGYISSEETLKALQDKNVELHVPKRKNQKEETSEITKKKLTKRYIVEHSIKDLKTLYRVRCRQDKYIENYMSFVFLGLIVKFNKCNVLGKYELTDEEIELKEQKAKKKAEKRKQKRLEAKEAYQEKKEKEKLNKNTLKEKKEGIKKREENLKKKEEELKKKEKELDDKLKEYQQKNNILFGDDKQPKIDENIQKKQRGRPKKIVKVIEKQPPSNEIKKKQRGRPKKVSS